MILRFVENFRDVQINPEPIKPLVLSNIGPAIPVCSSQIIVKPSLSVENISSDTISFFMRVVSATTEVIPIATMSRVSGVPVRKIVANVSHNIAAK